MSAGSTPDYRGLAGAGAGGDEAASEAGPEEGEAIIIRQISPYTLLSSPGQVGRHRAEENPGPRGSVWVCGRADQLGKSGGQGVRSLQRSHRYKDHSEPMGL